MSTQYKWRVRARVVAYVNLILIVIGAILYKTLYLGIFNKSLSKNSFLLELDFYGFKISPDEDAPWLLYTRTAVHAIIYVIFLWTAMSLLSATDAEADPVEALRRAKIWLAVFILDNLLYTFGRIYNDFLVAQPEKLENDLLVNSISLLIYFPIILMILYIVAKFIIELKLTAKTDNLPSYVVCKL